MRAETGTKTLPLIICLRIAILVLGVTSCFELIKVPSISEKIKFPIFSPIEFHKLILIYLHFTD